MRKYLSAAAVVLVICLGLGGNAAADTPLPDLSRIQILDLPTAQRIALAENPSLAAVADRIAQARERVRQAWAAYWPTLNASASAARVEMSDTDYQTALATARLFSPSATVDNPEAYYKAGLVLNWRLFDGFGREFARSRSEFGEAESRAAGADARRLLLGAVAQGYYTAQLARENIAVARADEAFNARQVKEAQARYDLGAGPYSDILNFRVLENSAISQRIQAERDFHTSLIALASLLGVKHSSLPEGLDLSPLATPPRIASAESAKALIRYALAHRPDIRQQRLGIHRAEAAVGQAEARFYPTVDLTGTVNGNRPDDPSFRGEDFGNTVGLYFNYNLFSGGADRARVAEARKQKMEIAATLAQSELTVASEIRQTMARLSAARQDLALQQTNDSLVEENRDLVAKEYAAGQASLVRLNEAQRNRVQAQVRLAQAKVSLLAATAALDTATAKILTAYGSTP